jgi:glycosyltransferase involved in cell wall biosynthesis
MAAHARLFAHKGYSVTLLAGRGPDSSPFPGIEIHLEPLLDSKNERLLELNRVLDNGQVPPDFENYTAELYDLLKIRLEDNKACFVHNAFTMHKNLPLTAALFKLAEINSLKLVAWTHDLAWADPLYAKVLHQGYPWDLLRSPAPGVQYVTVSPERQRALLEIFRPPVTANEVPVVPNGIELEEFLGISSNTIEIIQKTGIEKARREGALLLLLPSRITRRKNIELAIKTLGVLKRQGENARLIVTGPPGPHNIRNDEYVRELFALREDWNVRDEAIFLMERWQEANGKPRFVSDQAIFELYRYCDALLFPSAQEGFGIPILEAGLARLPVFCADIPPLRKIAGDNAVYFSPESEPEVVAQKLLAELNGSATSRLRREVIGKYTWDSIFSQQIEPLSR